MSTTTTYSFTTETKISDIVTAQPALARVLERLGLDYCCAGKQPLAQACARLGLDAEMILSKLNAASLEAAKKHPVIDGAKLTLTQLVDHIEHTHHLYAKTELTRLLEMAHRVATKHGWRDARLAEVNETFQALAEEMTTYMAKEERVLFPFIREFEVNTDAQFRCGANVKPLAQPIAHMEAAHASAASAVARLRLLTDGFKPDADACNTHRAMLVGFAEFEADLHLHVHMENNVLFPRVLALANANHPSAVPVETGECGCHSS